MGWCAFWCNKGHNHRSKSNLYLHKNLYRWQGSLQTRRMTSLFFGTVVHLGQDSQKCKKKSQLQLTRVSKYAVQIYINKYISACANLQRRKSSPSLLQSAGSETPLFSLNLAAGHLHQLPNQTWGWVKRGEEVREFKTNLRSWIPKTSPWLRKCFTLTLQVWFFLGGGWSLLFSSP